MNDDRLYLVHILECIERIITYTADGRASFMASTLIQDAVLRNLQTMSESTQRLSDALKQQHQEVDWRGLSGFRNVLVHDYLGTDLNTVWRLVEDRMPELKRQISEILESLNGDE